MKSVKTVGIISAISEKFHVRKVGFVVFQNEARDFPIESWGINEMVAGKVRTALSRRFDVRPVTYRRSAFTALGNNQTTIADTIRAEVSPPGLDAYIVVGNGGAQYLKTNQQLFSLGIVEGTGTYYFLYALYEITVIDPREGTSRGRSRASLPGHPKFMDAIKGPYREVDSSWWPTALDAASNQKLRAGVTELIDQSLPNTLREMQLVD